MPESNTEPMDLSRLAAILDAYGADPRRWPETEADAALALLAASAEARRLRDAAASLDMLLDRSVQPLASPSLMAAVLADARPGSRARWLADFWPFGPLWQPASALATAIVLGIAVGAGAPDVVLPDYGDAAISEVESLAFGPALILEEGL